MKLFSGVSILLFLMVLGCSDSEESENDSVNIPDDQDQEVPNSNFTIATGATFEWRLDDLPNNYITDAQVIDIDAFSATPELVANLKSQGKTVIAYLSVGSVENFRDDANDFPKEVIGNVYEGFEDENWLDIRKISLIAPIMEKRLDMIAAKSFDGIEPDNINGYQNNTGFNLNEADARTYSRYLIEQAHKRNLSIGQKNAEEIIPTLADEFDWILTEDAFADDFYQQLTPYITLGKAVFMVEYTDRISSQKFKKNACPEASTLSYFALLKDRDLKIEGIKCD